MILRTHRLLLIVLCAAFAFGAPAAGSFAGEPTCMQAMNGDDGGAAPDCGCDLAAMTACATACGFLSTGWALSASSALAAIAVTGEMAPAFSPGIFLSRSARPGLQPPR